MRNSLIIPSAEPFLFPGGKTGCVLVHGFTGAPKEMRMMGEALNKNGITVVGVRLAGHATCMQDLVRKRWEDWLVSVEDGIHLLSNLCDEVFIAGLSLGGILSLITASRNNHLKGVIAMATPYSLPNDWRLKIARPMSVLFPFIKKTQSETLDSSSVKDHIEFPAYPTIAIAELYDLIKVMWESLPEIKIPVFLINSITDKTVPINHAEKIKHAITNASVDQLVIEKSGHVITEDLDRDQVFNAAYQFIYKHSSK